MALAVETADCVPLVLIDTATKCTAIVHAGWRGAVAGVVASAVQAMERIGCRVEAITAYFGPAARACCYEVSPNFLDNFDHAASEPFFCRRAGLLYFDNVTFIADQLVKMGLGKKIL